MSWSSPLIAKVRDPVLVDERGGDVVLGRERVRGAEDDLGAARLQRAHQVRRLGRHVEAGGDAVAGERLLALEALADRGEHRHLPVGPLDPPHAFGGEREILDVVLDGRGHGSSLGLGSGGEQPLVLALLPFDPVGLARALGGHGRAGEPALDRGPQLGLAPEPDDERDVVELDVEAAPQVGEAVAGGRARASP